MPGGRGAPLLPEEAAAVNDAVSVATRYLSERNRRYIERFGAVEGDDDDDLATVCIDDRDCVFVYDEGGVAKCAIERAYFNGETDFRKPLSCHLFPIRINELFGGSYLRYEKIQQCTPALVNGARQDVPLYRFLEEALVRAFGRSFYDQLAEAVEEHWPELKRKTPPAEPEKGPITEQ